ncbi:hypothetical protein [Enterobacter asburiae]|nr:hypothetical protein [Enterobacter asburiae]
MFQFLSGKNFKSGGALYSELLGLFNNVPEQPNETLRKIFSGSSHRNVLRADNLEDMLTNLLLRMDLRTVFELLRSKNSKAQPDTVETMFEEFVSFLNSVVGNFLPWLLRGLERLSKFGSEEAAAINWSNMAKDIEAALSATGGETAADDSLVPIE